MHNQKQETAHKMNKIELKPTELREPNGERKLAGTKRAFAEIEGTI